MTTSSMEQLKEINDLSLSNGISSADDYYVPFETQFGGFWCSRRHIPTDIHYQTRVPTGIHLGAGIASIEMQGRAIGHHHQHGAFASCLLQPDGNNEEITTTLGRGNALSCGLYVAWDKVDKLPSELAPIINLTTSPVFRASDRISPLVIEKLCAPIDARYQGFAQSLLEEARAYELLANIITAFTRQSRPLTVNARHAMAARDFIEVNLMKPLTLQFLAREVGLNVRSLTQVFRREFGLSINNYMTERRLSRAMEMLESGLSVSQTAYQVGYSLPYFSERFHKRFGLSPSQVASARGLPKNENKTPES